MYGDIKEPASMSMKSMIGFIPLKENIFQFNKKF